MLRISVKVIPRSSQESVHIEGEALKVRVKTPPVEGRANEELVRMLAKLFHLPRSAVTIVSGRSSKNKIVDIEGITRADLKKIALD